MHPCAWRKGCQTEAFTGERFCYYHSKRRGESITESGTARDQFSSEALEILRASRLLGITLAQLDAQAQPEAHRGRSEPRSSEI